MTLETIGKMDLPEGLGGAKPIQLPATRYTQGGRTQYHITIPLWHLANLIVTRPDPNKTLEGNRRVDGGRADKFGKYLLEQQGWVSPAIIVRVPASEPPRFDAKQVFEDGTAWGVLEIRLDLLPEIVVLDGQHRTLGVFRAQEKIIKEIGDIRALIKKMKEINQNDDGIAEQNERIKKLEEKKYLLTQEHFSIDIVVVDRADASQMFGDINNNAKGVNADLRTVLDQNVFLNQVALRLMNEHPLLIGRVEQGEKARFSSTNVNLIGAKGVSDIARSVYVGSGRISKRLESELQSSMDRSVQTVKMFFDVLLESFPDLAAIQAEKLDPIGLRSRSMLGSMTMLRALAHTYYNLTHPEESGGGRVLSRDEVKNYFGKLSTRMSVPITGNDAMWLSTNAVRPGDTAPSARSQDFKALVDSLTRWGRSGLPN